MMIAKHCNAIYKRLLVKLYSKSKFETIYMQ